MKSYLINIIFLFLFTSVITAQSTTLFTASNCNTLDNHSVVNVRTFFKDKFNFIWVASQDGLLRYDGKNSVLYSKDVIDKRHKLLSNDADAIIADNDDDFIWILSSYGGIVKVDIRTGCIVKEIVFNSPSLSAKSFYFRGIEKDGIFLFIITEEGFIFKINTLDNSWGFQKIKITNRDSRINYFYKLNEYFVLFSDGNSVCLYDYKAEKILDVEPCDYKVYTKSGIVLQDTLFVGTNSGIQKILVKNNQLLLDKLDHPSLNNAKIFSVGFFSGSLFFSADDNFYQYDYKNKIYTKLYPSSGLEKRKWYKNIIAYQALGNDLWIGNELGISVVKFKSAFTPFYEDLNTRARLSHCYGINGLNDTNFVVTCSDGIYNFNPQRSAITHIDQSGYFLNSFCINKSVIVSGLKGTFVLENNKLKKISDRFPQLKQLDNDVLIEPAFYKDSLIVLASQISNGLFIFDIKRSKLNTINLSTKPVQLQNLNINKLFFDRFERLWILSDNLISIYSLAQQTLENYTILNPQTGEPLNIIKDISYANGSYFIAAYGMGIFRINESMKVTASYGFKEGVLNTNVYKILQLDDSSIVVSSNYGLYALNMYTGKIKKYFEANGLHGNLFEQYSGIRYKNDLYFGGIDGITRIMPKSLAENNRPPELLINRIVITESKGVVDTSNLRIDRMRISNTVLQTKIIFSAINWSNNDEVMYKYRIVEQSRDWINLGTQNFLTLIGLSPGTYHLQVKAANEDGVWSEPKELILIFLPKWYQTWWFYLLITLTVAGILYSLYRYRISQIKKQHEIRKNIATDLHDDLGSTLNSVKVFTNLAISGVKQEESLQQVKDNLTEATMSLRDMIWVLDDSLDTVDELITRLKQFAIPVAAASNIEATIKADSDVNNRQLTKEEKRNLFLICKEAINNSIKYSGATQIDVSIIASGKKIQIDIADNGKGFNVDEVKKGYGLKNMQYRAGQVKYKVALISSLGKGTQIQIKPA